MSFVHQHQVRFHETDAAGVVYFANVLTLCHEAYESSLAASGVNLKAFFGGDGEIAVPIVHADIDFRRPIFCGDRLKIHLTPQSQDIHTFEITYQITDTADKADLLAKALTRHVCIALSDRKRRPLSPEITHWIEQWH
ncbi:MAG: thioesterase family protein [Leptolyngbyaceae cyanobacterium MO_188.B28]|nr:thioesterase family protein [Leptolyngbyaceae cyanobacterium MO_188.B28]